MPDVAVLLSTWNGMTFLPQQIDSLLDQRFDGSISIVVRDDGSTDGTVEYLRSRDTRIQVIEGDNLGPRDSFFALIDRARDLDAEVYALCDQDDFWRPHKLARAIARLPDDTPALYTSSLDLVNEDLEPIRGYIHPGDQSFASTLICNFATGCTCVFNRAFLDCAPAPAIRSHVLMHDWWLAAVATVAGRVCYDRISSIAYRQHASNHIGIASGLGSMVRKFWNAVMATPAVTRFDQARQLDAALGRMFDERERRVMNEFLRSEHSLARRSLFIVRHGRAVGLTAAIRFTLFG